MYKKGKSLIFITAVILWLINTTCATSSITPTPAVIQPVKNLIVHYIDVGQADSILIQTPNGKNMLIDTGNNEDSQTIISYLKSKNISTIDVLVGTHPHEDHIGSMDDVARNFTINSIYMPKATSNTSTFLDVLQAIKDKGFKITTPVPGGKINLDNDLDVTIVAPQNPVYEDLNNYSIVLKVTYKNNSFLFAGDAESISETEIIKSGFNIKADVLKVGHHGSNSSTTDIFLKAISPKYAIMSVGKGNVYGHPSYETIKRLTDNNVSIYRTDESGTIIITSDGSTIKIDKLSSTIKPNAPPVNQTSGAGTLIPLPGTEHNETIVYISKTGSKYHIATCRYLNDSKIQINLKDAKAKGYTPCKVCNPTQ